MANKFLDHSYAIIFLWKVGSKLWELYISRKNNPTDDFIVLEISYSLQTAHSKTFMFWSNPFCLLENLSSKEHLSHRWGRWPNTHKYLQSINVESTSRQNQRRKQEGRHPGRDSCTQLKSHSRIPVQALVGTNCMMRTRDRSWSGRKGPQESRSENAFVEDQEFQERHNRITGVETRTWTVCG